MFEILKKRIDSKDYELKKMLDLIDEMRGKEKITAEETDELYKMARENANPANSYAPLQEQINNLAARVKVLEENKKEIEPENPEEPVNEYPEFIEPEGAHDSYKIGDKITYENKKYICKIDGCVWSPKAYPIGWEEVVEDTAEITEEAE